MRGTRSSGISRPRSPRATMTPSDTSRMASIAATASGRSIFAMIGRCGAPNPAATSRTRMRSAADCTKLSATQSTPWAIPNCRSSTSFSVRLEAGSVTPGALMPLCSPSGPPLRTVGDDLVAVAYARPAARASRRRAGDGRRGAPTAPAARRSSTRARPADEVARGDAQRRPVLELDGAAALERAGADLRAAQVLQDGHDRAPSRSAAARMRRTTARVRLVRAVREVEAEDVDAGGDEVVELRRRCHRRADRGDDLRVSHAKELTIPAVDRPTTSGVMHMSRTHACREVPA